MDRRRAHRWGPETDGDVRRRAGVRRLAVAAALALALVPGSARADDRGRPADPGLDRGRSGEPGSDAVPLVWNPRWHRFRGVEYAATGFLLAGAFGSLLIPPAPTPWSGRNGFDESVRDAIRIDAGVGREAARDASDILISTHLAYPIFVDALVVAWSRRGSADVGWQMAAMDFEVYAATAFANGLTSALSSRERPYGRDCPADEARQNEDCRQNKRYRSFFSGHASTAFASAAVSCLHHQRLELYGGGAPDVVACATGFVTAGATAFLRVAADQHYASDVLIGAAVGTSIGLGLPYVLHYRASEPARRHGAGLDVEVALVPTVGGLSATGTF